MPRQQPNSHSTALVLIDVQNSFFHPDGGNYYPESSTVVPHLHRLLDRARGAGRLIIHVAEQHRPNVEDFETHKLPQHCVAGDFDAQFFEGFGPRDNTEFLLAKRRTSAFFATDLDLLLREKGIDRLVIAGVKANVCVRATVQDAFSLGYRCIIPRGAVNSNRSNLADASLEDIDRYLGWVVTVDEAEKMLS
ncbi:MAG: cysteine hydrolase [Gammaproteobacteria bacterium]|nr:cysteine hydrolase [Gammaproteobacteria bacterium]